MNTATYQIENRTELSARIFPYLVEHGLENITIREICRDTGIVQGSLYYWYGDKATIVCEATKWGLKKVTREIFAYALANLDDLRSFFANFLDEIDKYKNELRFAHQMVASPVYGGKIRAAGKEFDFLYEQFTRKLTQLLSYDEQTLKPLLHLFISAVLGYVIWDEREITQQQLKYIYYALPEKIRAEHEQIYKDD